MTLINVKCIDQKLFLANMSTIASGDNNETKIKFDFCSLWDGLGKVAIFYCNEDAVYNVVINNNESLEFEYGIGGLKEYCCKIPKGFKQINIPEHLWGKFYTKGKMPTAIQKLWKEVIDWVNNSEYEIATNYDFECYSEGDSDSDDYVSGIWAALKLKDKS